MKRSHESKGIYRTREETRMLREAVLDAWNNGEQGDVIAKRLWISRGYVDSLVVRARKAGDPRAAVRYASADDRERMIRGHDAKRLAAASERQRLIRSLRPVMAARSIAAVLGVSESTVYSAGGRPR
jgi:transposase